MRALLLWLAAGGGVLAASCRGCDETAGQPSSSAPSRSAARSIPSVGPAGSLSEQVRRARVTSGDYRPPTAAERDAYRRWVTAVAEAAWTARLPTERPPEGLVGGLADSGQLWLLHEDLRQKRGCAFVAIRPGRGAKVVIEAPHTYFEPGTLQVALTAFEALEASALLVNTFHRGGSGTKAERRERALSGKSEMDAAHSDTTCFAAAHAALLAAAEGVVTIQFHGFADERAPGVKVVVSASETKGDIALVAESLRAVLGRDGVRAYPAEIAILGGTNNTEARMSREADSPFVHIEMSRSFRKELKDGPARLRFVEALAEAVRNSGR